MKRKKFTKIALVLSTALLIAWMLLGTSSSIAWFQVEDSLVNSLNFGSLNINLFYKDSGTYKEVDESTEIFDSEQLYEPGFTYIVYFRIDNAGSMAFTYDMSVVPYAGSTVIGTSVLGNSIDLADYIKFGLVIGDTEEEVAKLLEDRDSARTYAVNKLSNYSQSGGTLSPGESDYAAIIVYMPEEVGNAANYRGEDIPQVVLGISAIANQVSG